MSNDTVVSLAVPAQVSDPLTELLRSGARRLIEAAVSAEFEEYLSGFVQEQLPDGRQRVVRNGHLPERKILTGVGEVDVRVPKARSRSGSPEPFPLFGGASLRSALRKPRCGDSVAVPARGVHRSDASGGRRAGGRGGRPWAVGERGQSAQAQLGRGVPPVVPSAPGRRVGLHLWADGIYSGLRGEHERLCVLVVIGVKRPRRETLPGHRGRGARVHPELARGAAGDEAARLHPPGEVGRRRRGAGGLGRRCRKCIQRPEPSAAGCTRPGTS